jgi:hypothetical protein
MAGGMKEFLPEGVPWLNDSDLYAAGAEMGALMTVMQFGAPTVLARIKSRNEEQLRAVVPFLQYRMKVLARTADWVDVSMEYIGNDGVPSILHEG